MKKSQLKGIVTIPASKSHTIRAVAIASLARGESLIRSPLTSSDTLSAVNCYRHLGAEIDVSKPNCWKVTGNSGKIACPDEPIDTGNSGTTFNIAMGSSSLVEKGKTIKMTGDEQTQARPVGPLLDALNKLGPVCQSIRGNGKPPVRITGQLTGGKTQVTAHSSQYLTSLLLCTPMAEKDTEIDVVLLNEPGYVQMTLDWLDKQGIKYQNDNFKKFKIQGRQNYKPFDSAVPADFSSATFFLCAAALYGDGVTLTGLDFADSQPDKAVVDYLRQMGADIIIGKDNLVTIKASQIKGAKIDMNKTPDALPAMSVTAAFAKGQTQLLNVPQARAKETDRIKCMAEELRKLQVDVEELPDGMIINGGKPKATQLDGRGDHRIVMALSLAGMAIDGECIIDTAEAISVTFPEFVRLMQSTGANMEIRE